MQVIDYWSTNWDGQRSYPAASILRKPLLKRFEGRIAGYSEFDNILKWFLGLGCIIISNRLSFMAPYYMVVTRKKLSGD
jgi:hypothetical protein